MLQTSITDVKDQSGEGIESFETNQRDQIWRTDLLAPSRCRQAISNILDMKKQFKR